ncbi:nuclear valosin-containing protein-like [Ornithodoros turicata]|uniref:nuclear valosin-containing protein-like n=1 Tax=Ornithodoros turicata TaxID=34597 RepID=UPI00313957BD
MNSNPDKCRKRCFGGDPRLLPRIKQVLEETTDPDDIADRLQNLFPEYRRKKRNPFVFAITEILQGLTQDTPDANMVNKSVTDLYKESPRRKKARKDDVDQVVEEAIEKRQKEVALYESTTRFSELGGIQGPLVEVCNMLIHLKHPEVYKKLGVMPPRGFLLHGPPGCGKTLLAHAVAGELELPMIKVAAPEVVAGVSGESEQRIRELFEKAVASAPCILFLDEIDAVTPKRETAQREMERRIVAQLLYSMDNLSQSGAQVLVIGATNRPDALDPALRRAGRFDREISLGIPNEAARSQILQVLCKKLTLSTDVDFEWLAHQTPGFVGADLMALTREATMAAINRVFHTTFHTECSKLERTLSLLRETTPFNEEQLANLSVEFQDFKMALKAVQPSATREGFASVPHITWDHVGALTHVREALQIAIMGPVKHREKYESLGLTTSTGILLYGPPGCGKTLLAKAVANEAGINFISVKGPELLNMYVGESERAVRLCFQRARNSAPCVIFFDELDALCPRRSDAGEGGATARVVNQMLTEMDGLEPRKQVFVLAATNRLDIIDHAMLRPGRLDQTLYVGLPSDQDRVDILHKLTRIQPKLHPDVSLRDLAARCQRFSGADLAALVRQASILALTEHLKDETMDLLVTAQHFDAALHKVKPSIAMEKHGQS